MKRDMPIEIDKEFEYKGYKCVVKKHPLDHAAYGGTNKL